MTLETRKYRLIKLITSLENERLIAHLERLFDDKEEGSMDLFELVKPTRERLDIEDLIKEQNYTHPSKKALDSILEAINLEEPIEDLINQI